MICSNEPGYYKTGEYGIRIENLIVVTEPEDVPGGERKMMRFETITLAPIDVDLVEPKLLTAEERDWLNAYHARVRETLTPLVDDETQSLARQRDAGDLTCGEPRRSLRGAMSHRLIARQHASQGQLPGRSGVRDVDVYVPAEPAPEGLPLLVDLVGFTAGGPVHTNWKNFSENMPERLDRLISSGAMPPCVVAFPDCFTKLGGNQYINSARHGPVGRCPDHEGIRPVRGTTNSRCGGKGKRGVFGKSSGGYGAIAHALLYPRFLERGRVPFRRYGVRACLSAPNSRGCCARSPSRAAPSRNGSTRSTPRPKRKTATSTI